MRFADAAWRGSLASPGRIWRVNISGSRWRSRATLAGARDPSICCGVEECDSPERRDPGSYAISAVILGRVAVRREILGGDGLEGRECHSGRCDDQLIAVEAGEVLGVPNICIRVCRCNA